MRMNETDYKEILQGETLLSDVLRECIDKCDIFMINEKDKQQLECNSNCNHCMCHFKNRQCDGSCGGNLDPECLEEINGIIPCPDIYDYQNKELKPGYALLSKNNVFEDETDNPQSFTYITVIPEIKFEN